MKRPPLRWFSVFLILTLLVAGGCGGGGAKTDVPDEAKKLALAKLGGSVEEVYGEAVSTFGEEFAKGSRADEPVYGILVSGDFEFQGSQFSTAEVVFDGGGKVLLKQYWVDARPSPPPFSEHPKADAIEFDPAVLTGG